MSSSSLLLLSCRVLESSIRMSHKQQLLQPHNAANLCARFRLTLGIRGLSSVVVEGASTYPPSGFVVSGGILFGSPRLKTDTGGKHANLLGVPTVPSTDSSFPRMYLK